jgi:hypothetical protein
MNFKSGTKLSLKILKFGTKLSSKILTFGTKLSLKILKFGTIESESYSVLSNNLII